MPTPQPALLSLIDSVAALIAQAYQLARIRLASAASPVLRLLIQRDSAYSNAEMLKREIGILRAQRRQVPPHRRPTYRPQERLAILQLRRLRVWSIAKTARRFVVHPNTIRSWIRAIEGRGNESLLLPAVVWNRLDDVVRWTVHQLRRLCPEPELGTRSIARHLVRAGLAISRSTVQRILREQRPRLPRRPKPPLAAVAGVKTHHLLLPKRPNHVWHLDLTSLRLLWFRFSLAAVLDGFSRKLLILRIYSRTPRQRDMTMLVHRATRKYGSPKFLITDHGTQFRKRFHAGMSRRNIRHVRGRVRAPYLNGKVERLFRTFRIWWIMVLCGFSRASIQRRLNNFQHWYNHHQPHTGIHGLTPHEAWISRKLPQPTSFRANDTDKPFIRIGRINCRGDPGLPVILIQIQRAA